MVKIIKLIKRIENIILNFYWKSIVPKLLENTGVKFSTSCIFYGMPIVSKTINSTIELGDFVILCSHSKYTDLGVNHPVILRVRNDNASIIIGSHTGISGATICCSEQITIGDYCLLGANVTIVDTDFHSINPENRRYNRENIQTSPVNIGNNVFIGANSIVLKGVRIGNNSVIGAGSVVTQDVPENTIFAGNPAKKIGTL